MDSRKKMKKQKSSLLSNILFFVFLLIFAFALYKIVSYFNEGNQEKELINEIISEGIRPVVIPGQNDQTSGGSVLGSDQGFDNSYLYPDIEVDFSALKRKYPGIVGWIYNKGTPMHYPVMQSEDNDYYLYRLPNGRENISGSIFMDFRNSSSFLDFNHILYGHNMLNGEMFGSIMDYRYQEHYDEHPVMFLFTPGQTYRLEIFAGLYTNATSYVFSYPKTLAEKQEYLSTARKSSVLQTKVEVTVNDRIVIMSTCVSSGDSPRRYLVMAKMVSLNDNTQSGGTENLNQFIPVEPLNPNDPPPPSVYPETPPVTEPEIPPATEPETPPVTEPETPPVTEPETPPVTEPETPPVTEPETPPVTEPETPPATEPETPPVTEPETPPVTEPVTPPATEPVTPPATEPVTPPATEPETPPITEPVTPPVTEPVTPPVTEPETPPATESETPSATTNGSES